MEDRKEEEGLDVPTLTAFTSTGVVVAHTNVLDAEARGDESKEDGFKLRVVNDLSGVVTDPMNVAGNTAAVAASSDCLNRTLLQQSVACGHGKEDFGTPQTSRKKPPEKCHLKTKNSTNKKRASVGLSIEHLCDQIGKTSAEILHSENSSSSSDVSISQIIAMQLFQSQLQGQDHKIEKIE